MLVALAGGVGGAKLLEGLQMCGRLDTVAIVNTGDDFDHLGLRICPDVDTVTYTLADVVDREKGWGRADETWVCLDTLHTLGGPAWFLLGDKDLAVHLERTRRLALGDDLQSITDDIRVRLGVKLRIVPMTEDRVRTRIRSRGELIDFQDYFVRLRCEPEIDGIEFDGIADAKPSTAALTAIRNCDEAIILCPSNPFVSIDPILGLEAVREAIAMSAAPCVAVSPIVGGAAIKGPAAKMFRELGVEPSTLAVAERYRDLLDGFVIDEADLSQADAIRGLGIEVLSTKTIMRNGDDRRRLASEVIRFARDIAPGNAG